MKQVLKKGYEYDFIFERDKLCYLVNNCKLKHYIKSKLARRRRREAKQERLKAKELKMKERAKKKSLNKSFMYYFLKSGDKGYGTTKPFWYQGKKDGQEYIRYGLYIGDGKHSLSHFFDFSPPKDGTFTQEYLDELKETMQAENFQKQIKKLEKKFQGQINQGDIEKEKAYKKIYQIFKGKGNEFKYRTFKNYKMKPIDDMEKLLTKPETIDFKDTGKKVFGSKDVGNVVSFKFKQYGDDTARKRYGIYLGEDTEGYRHFIDLSADKEAGKFATAINRLTKLPKVARVQNTIDKVKDTYKDRIKSGSMSSGELNAMIYNELVGKYGDKIVHRKFKPKAMKKSFIDYFVEYYEALK